LLGIHIACIRYDISRIKMKANDTLTSSETATDEAIALGIDIKLPLNRTFNTIIMRFIVSGLNAFIINRSGGVVVTRLLLTSPA
jgi:hypothetical protein